MILVLGAWTFLRALLGRSTAVTLENVALRHQLMVLHRTDPDVSPALTLRLRDTPSRRRELLHIAVTDHPTAAWAAQQIVHALPDETGPAYLLRDRDAIYGGDFQRRVERMGIRRVASTPRAPWQNPFAESAIGSIRRDGVGRFGVDQDQPLPVGGHDEVDLKTRLIPEVVEHSRSPCPHLVPPFFENFGKRRVKSPKLYFVDSGLACHVLGLESDRGLSRSPFLGPLFEGLVASGIVKHQ